MSPQVLQMGFNKLRNLTEGMLRGLGKLQYLYLQANLIETVTPNTFWECPNIENIDLSMNRYRPASVYVCIRETENTLP